MKKDTAFEDKRLLEAINHIDSRYVSETMEYYGDLPPVGGSPERDKKVTRKSIRYAITIAACLVLISAVLPVVSYITGGPGFTPGGTLAGSESESETAAEVIDSENVTEAIDSETTSEPAESEPDPDVTEEGGNSKSPDGFNYIKHIGEVPEEFAEIVKTNFFKDIYVNNGVLSKYADAGEAHDIELFDIYGKLIAEIDFKDTVVVPRRISVLSDGTYITRSGYDSYYTYRMDPETGKSKSEQVVKYPRVVRFDKDGNILFDITLDVKSEIGFFVETPNGYIVAGSTMNIVGLNTDYYYVFSIDKSGNILSKKTLGGEKYDALHSIEYTKKDGLVLYVRQSMRNGNKYYAYQKLYLYEYTLEIKRTEIIDSAPTSDAKIYQSITRLRPYWYIQDFLPDFDGGRVTAAIEYDDFYLIVSEHDTKYFGLSDYASSTMLFYTETVYSAYTKDGELIWRSAVDSSDYEKFREISDKYDGNWPGKNFIVELD